MKYRQSLLTYAQKYGVSRASRKYNKSRSYIYFWRARYDGSLQSLACQSRRPHSHPNQHTPEELKLISDMHRRNPKLGIVELWARMRKRGYTRTIESLWRVMRREGWTAQVEKKKPYKPKPYEQMQYPGQRVQIDVKVVPRRCIADPELKLYQYTAIDEYSRYRVLGALFLVSAQDAIAGIVCFLCYLLHGEFLCGGLVVRTSILPQSGSLFRACCYLCIVLQLLPMYCTSTGLTFFEV